ncbi:undecaprenyl-diphosphate phosphatase [Clostridium sp. A1-XYC3]|uniref:Undecaprenyl-diphosphatase n=1 Tax=Clostridium tanneri TaxID=3037988 RepID=A0ABU4JRK6_9CLOT|nr:undecaprenyl-diphosphate phosphatase [Clostridium sp. A1-XYC3]MDW8800786.1 undecaprenyl-diphosphate phosphatase [Clostridium sp. A1-XYC3]
MDLIFILKAVLIAVVEGITEFIPVSSTGHMILVGWAIGFKGEFAKMFEVVIQLGAIMAVVVLYWGKIEESIRDFLKFIITRGREGKTGFRFGINVITASIPMAVVGVLFYDKIKSKFVPEAVILGFIVGGFLLIIIEKVYRNKAHRVESLDNITVMQAFKVGVLQLLAVWPGMSRSASTIMGGWVAGLSTAAAAEFSFFIAIPAMVGSSAKDLFEFDFSIMTGTLWVSLAVGFIVAFIVALIVIKKFIDYLKKKPMKVFAVYRIAAGTLLGILVLTNIITLT